MSDKHRSARSDASQQTNRAAKIASAEKRHSQYGGQTTTRAETTSAAEHWETETAPHPFSETDAVISDVLRQSPSLRLIGPPKEMDFGKISKDITGTVEDILNAFLFDSSFENDLVLKLLRSERVFSPRWEDLPRRLQQKTRHLIRRAVKQTLLEKAWKTIAIADDEENKLALEKLDDSQFTPGLREMVAALLSHPAAVAASSTSRSLKEKSREANCLAWLHNLANESTEVLKASRTEMNSVLQRLKGHRFGTHNELSNFVHDIQEIARRGGFQLALTEKAAALSKSTRVRVTFEQPTTERPAGRMVVSKLGDTGASARRVSVLPICFV